MSIIHTTFSRPSANGEGSLFSQKWVDSAMTQKAVVQIAHGMNEHSGRYDRFARFLAEQGYAVYANDHIGHGQSDFSHRGTFSLQKGGFEFLLQDIHSLFSYAMAENPNLPRLLFGHSMGSLAAGLYPTRFDDIDALLLMGTPAQNPVAGFGILIADLTVLFRGRTARSKFLTKAAEANMGKGSSDPMVRHGWLTRDREEVLRFTNDALNGDSFSASAFGEMLAALREFGKKDWARRVPEMPILITAGTADSVGALGKGPFHYYQLLIDSGHKDVTLKLYEGARHELLNELNRDEVHQDLLSFINKALEHSN